MKKENKNNLDDYNILDDFLNESNKEKVIKQITAVGSSSKMLNMSSCKFSKVLPVEEIEEFERGKKMSKELYCSKGESKNNALKDIPIIFCSPEARKIINKNAEGKEITVTADLDVNEFKFLYLGLHKYNLTKNRRIELDTEEVANWFGYILDYEEYLNQGYSIENAKAKVKNNRRVIRRILNKICIRLSFVTIIEKNLKEKTKEFNYIHLADKLITDRRVDEEDIIDRLDEPVFYGGIIFTKKFLNYIKDGKKCFTIDPKILHIDSKNNTAFNIALTIFSRENIENNIRKGTNNKIRISNLLKNCPDIPTSEEIEQSKSKRSLEDRIIKPMDHALNILLEQDILKSFKIVDGYDNDIGYTTYNEFKNAFLVWELTNPPYSEEKIKEIKKKKNKNKTKKKKEEKTEIITETFELPETL